MTTFRDLGDVVSDGDELDPSRPDYGTDEPIDDEEQSEDQDAWSPAQGFCPKDGLLRIWVDDQVHLTKMRLSPNWRERAKGATIETLLQRAFRLAEIALSRRPNPLQFPPSLPEAKARPLSGELLQEINNRQAEVLEQLAALDQRGGDQPGRWEGASVTGRALNHKCTVKVSCLGVTESVEFDDLWLKTASALQIADALVTAHKDAYAKLGEPTYVPGERERLAYHMLEIQEELEAAMRRGLK